MTGSPRQTGGVARLARALLWPVRRLLDPRFADVGRRLDVTRDRLLDESRQIEATQTRLNELVSSFGAASGESMTFVGRELRGFETTLAGLADRLETVERTIHPIRDADRVDTVIAGGVDGLDANTVRLLHHAQGHEGFAAERGLWINPPLTLAFRPGGVELGSLNERIVEIPYAFRALAGLPPGARILDVGSVESTVALSLASLGYRVTALDLRPYPFRHPNLEVAVTPLEDFAPKELFDAILCISTIEHVGLGWYGDVPQEGDADRRAIRRLLKLVPEGGRLVLTVPYGVAAIDSVQRTYDDVGLDGLLEGWHVETSEIVRQLDDRTWGGGEPEDPHGRGVAMVTAVRPAGA
jgi:SAM-dependent methyltransferase